MNKSLSTYERKMQNKQFKQVYKRSYDELLFSELLISVIESDVKFIRELAKEIKLSFTVL